MGAEDGGEFEGMTIESLSLYGSVLFTIDEPYIASILFTSDTTPIVLTLTHHPQTTAVFVLHSNKTPATVTAKVTQNSHFP